MQTFGIPVCLLFFLFYFYLLSLETGAGGSDCSRSRARAHARASFYSVFHHAFNDVFGAASDILFYVSRDCIRSRSHFLRSYGETKAEPSNSGIPAQNLIALHDPLRAETKKRSTVISTTAGNGSPFPFSRIQILNRLLFSEFYAQNIVAISIVQIFSSRYSDNYTDK